MAPILEIFSQGEEVVTGQIVDSNAAWLSEQTVKLGFTLARHSAVGDKLSDLVDLLTEISQRADCCICTGGLGPTCDDLTAEAVAMAFNLPLAFDAIAYEQIAQFFIKRNRAMPESNRKQAMLPKTALRLDNHWGTAPGFAIKHDRCWFVFLPGVPSEMKAIFQQTILPMLNERFDLNPKSLVTIKTIGIGESDLQQRINTLSLPSQVELGFRADIGEVQTKLLFPADFPTLAKQSLVQEIAEMLGDFVYTIDDTHNASKNLYTVIDQLMRDRKLSLSIIETVSQGYITSACLGAVWLQESGYWFQITKLVNQFNVKVENNDIVSLAKALAAAKRQQGLADLILVQLYEGHTTDLTDPEKNVTITTLLSSTEGESHRTDQVFGAAIRKQKLAGLMALDLLRRFLQSPP
jgi:competence/damage-inducible protein CinA-like protein